MVVSAKAKLRITSGLKKFQTVLNTAKARDINESDTVTIIVDMLSAIFGYDKYSEITSEYSIKKTFCDLAIKVDDKIQLLIEVKAIGLDLKDDYIKQAVDYGANEGVDWVILTNGVTWKIFKITFAKPLDKELICEFDMTKLSTKSQNDLELLFMLSRETITKSALDDYRVQKQALSKYHIGNILLTESVLNAIRTTLKKTAPDVKVVNEQISKVLSEEVIKREVFDGDRAIDAQKKITKALKQTKAKITAEKLERQDGEIVS